MGILTTHSAASKAFLLPLDITQQWKSTGHQSTRRVFLSGCGIDQVACSELPSNLVTGKLGCHEAPLSDAEVTRGSGHPLPICFQLETKEVKTFLSTWEKQWNVTAKLKIPVTKSLCVWAAGGPEWGWGWGGGTFATQLSGHGGWKEWESPENHKAAGRGAGMWPWSTWDSHCPFALFSGGENYTPCLLVCLFVFPNPDAKPKTLAPTFAVKGKRSETSEMLIHQRPFSCLGIWSVIIGFRKVLGGPVSSGNSVGFMVSVSRVFCLPWSSTEMEFAEEVSTSSLATER